MAHKVKCLYCCVSFDADTEDFVKHGNRYAHRECAERIEAGLEVKKIVSEETPQRLIDLQNLKDYINELYHKQCNWQMIMQQIKKFEAEEYTLSGMQKTLYYWYEVKKNPVSKSKQTARSKLVRIITLRLYPLPSVTEQRNPFCCQQ